MSNSEMMEVLCAKYNWIIINAPDSDQVNGNMVYEVRVLRNNMTGFLGDNKRITISPIYYYDNKHTGITEAPPKQFKVTISAGSAINPSDTISSKLEAFSVHYMYTTYLENGSLEYIGEYSTCCSCGDPCNSASQICSRCARNPVSQWM